MSVSSADKSTKRNRKPSVPIYRPPTTSHSDSARSDNSHSMEISPEDQFVLEVEDANGEFHHLMVSRGERIEDVVEKMSSLCSFSKEFTKALEIRLQREFDHTCKQ